MKQTFLPFVIAASFTSVHNLQTIAHAEPTPLLFAAPLTPGSHIPGSVPRQFSMRISEEKFFCKRSYVRVASTRIENSDQAPEVVSTSSAHLSVL